MYIKHFNFIAVLAVLLFTLLIITHRTKAQDIDSVTGLVVSPPQIVKDVEVGGTFIETFKIINQRNSPENIFVTTRQLARDQNGEYFVPDGFENNEVSLFEQNGWLVIAEKEFVLNNGEFRDIDVQFSLPDDLDQQGYYLELVFSTTPLNVDEGSVSLAPEIAIPIAINYLGEEQTTFEGPVIQVNSFSVDAENALYEFPVIGFNTHLINDGNLNIRPRGEIFIATDSSFNNIIATINFNEGGQLILANSGRFFENTWEEGFIVIDRNGNLSINFDQFDKFRLFQNYHAQLNVFWNQNGRDEFITSNASFWIVPWRIILVLLLIILIIGYVIYRKLRRNESG